ncbi:cofG, partial [Symbiodinium sp. KB8]
MSSVATRKAPNAFNFLRQITVLERCKSAQVLARVTDSVRVRGLRYLISHEAIAKDVLNVGWTSGREKLEAWAVPLTNGSDDTLVMLFWDRLRADHDNQPREMRKPVAFRDAWSLHKVTGGFLHFMAELKKSVSEADFERERENLMIHFMSGCLDPELGSALENSVPPGDLKSIGLLRDIINNVQHRATLEAEARNDELAKKVAEATAAQISAQLLADIDVLKQRLPSPSALAQQAALDVKYVRDRQKYAEFGLASCQRSLEGKTPKSFYFGVLRADQKDVQAEMATMAYNHWDSSNFCPPRSRPVEAPAESRTPLQLLTWVNGRPGWPSDVLSKFAPGSKEHDSIKKLKEEFEQICPAATETSPLVASSPANPSRAQGSPDFSIDNGKKPLDLTRLLDLQTIPNDQFTQTRPYTVI